MAIWEIVALFVAAFVVVWFVIGWLLNRRERAAYVATLSEDTRERLTRL